MFRNFEKCLMMSGRGLNVNVSPMDPVHNCPIQRHWRLPDIQREVTNFFKVKSNDVQLIVVIIPDFPPGVYGKQ